MDLVQPSAYFTHPANWSVNPMFYRGYICSVKRAVVGLEQRSCFNSKVRRRLEYTAITGSQQESYYLKKYMKANRHLIWGVPIWMHEMVLTAIASTDALEVDSTTHRELEVDQEVVLFTNYSTYEVGTIQTIGSTTITLDSAVSSSWSIGTKVYPILRSEIESFDGWLAKAPDIFIINISFSESFRGSY